MVTSLIVRLWWNSCTQVLGCCFSVYLTLLPHWLHYARLITSVLFTISLNLLRFMSIESVMPSNHLILCSLLLLPSIFPASGSFPVSPLFTSGGQIISASVLASVLPVNTRGWVPLGLTGLLSLQSKGLSSVFSSTTVQKHQFLALSLLYGPALTSVHDCWKNRSFDYTDLSWQSDVSAF